MRSCSPIPEFSWRSPLPLVTPLGWRIGSLSQLSSPRAGEGLKLPAQAPQGDYKILLGRDGRGCDYLGMSRGLTRHS